MRMVESAMIGLLVVSAPAGFVAAANFIPANFDVTLSNQLSNATGQATDGHGGQSPKAKPPKKPKPYPAEGPGLRGATLPHCSPGEYSAGYFCKPSPPNYYVPVGSLYPLSCPENTISPMGSQSKSQCKKPESKGWKLFS
jgi:hypothetical protein